MRVHIHVVLEVPPISDRDEVSRDVARAVRDMIRTDERLGYNGNTLEVYREDRYGHRIEAPGHSAQPRQPLRVAHPLNPKVKP